GTNRWPTAPMVVACVEQFSLTTMHPTLSHQGAGVTESKIFNKTGSEREFSRSSSIFLRRIVGTMSMGGELEVRPPGAPTTRAGARLGRRCTLGNNPALPSSLGG